MLVLAQGVATATPANKKAAANHFEHFLPANLTDCTLCHLPSANHAPESLEEFPHNAFGRELAALGKKSPLPERLQQVAKTDSDADGVSNLTEILLGGHPGDAQVKPASLTGLPEKEKAKSTVTVTRKEKRAYGFQGHSSRLGGRAPPPLPRHPPRHRCTAMAVTPPRPRARTWMGAS